MKELKIELSGRVQGISFRAITKKFADKIGLKGYVSNRDDGSVSIVAQGSEEQLKELTDWIKSNPGASKINNIKLQEQDAEKEYSDFQVIKKDPFLEDQKKSFSNLGKSVF